MKKIIIFTSLCFLFSTTFAQAQVKEDEFNSLLVDMAKANMPDYELIRKKIVEAVDVNNLNSFRPSDPLAKAMLPIIKLYKQHMEIVQEFNDIWSSKSGPDGALNNIGKAQGSHRSEKIERNIESTRLPNIVTYSFGKFIWPPWKVRIIESEKINDGKDDKYTAGHWIIDEQVTDQDIKHKSLHAYWARIAILEYLLKYERDSYMQKLIIGMKIDSDVLESKFKGAFSNTGDILIPFAQQGVDDDIKYLYWMTLFKIYLMNTDIIADTNNNTPIENDLKMLCIKKAVETNAVNSIDSLCEIKKKSENKSLNIYIDDAIKDLGKSKADNIQQINWLEILK